MRHVNVFQKPGGKCVHDRSWDDDQSSKEVGPLVRKTPIAPPVLFPLIHLFVQFSREVQGGSVKRLVFRNPAEYAPTVKTFRPTLQQSASDDKPPLVIYIAHNESFIVTVTETVPVNSPAADIAGVETETPPALTITEFCDSCLDFLSKEQAAYRSTVRNDSADDTISRNALSSNGESSLHDSQNFETQSDGSASYDRKSSEPLRQQVLHHQAFSVDEARLSEYISKMQKLLRM